MCLLCICKTKSPPPSGPPRIRRCPDAPPPSHRYIPPHVQSVFGMRSITYFVPMYAETVLYSRDNLRADGVLEHFVDLYSDEWQNFCARVFYGAAPDTVLKAFFAPDRALARLFLKAREQALKGVWDRIEAWPGPRSPHWPSAVEDYPPTLAHRYFPHDPPPPMPPTWKMVEPVPPEEVRCPPPSPPPPPPEEVRCPPSPPPPRPPPSWGRRRSCAA